MDRTLKLKILYPDGTTAVDITGAETDEFGIVSGSVSLQETLMADSFAFGQVCSDLFECQIFSRKSEQLDFEHTLNSGTCIFSVYDGTTKVKSFTGKIDSCTCDSLTYDYSITAYDALFELRDKDATDAWNNLWTRNTDTTLTLATIVDDIVYTAIGYHVTMADTLPNYTFALSQAEWTEVDTITVGQVLQMFGELLCGCPKCVYADDGTLSSIKLQSINTSTYTSPALEKESCSFEAYTTQFITGVQVYATSAELSQEIGTSTNPLIISGNLALIYMTSADITTVCQNILLYVDTLSYMPATLQLVLSSFSVNLGDMITTNRGTHLVTGYTYSGSLLVNEQIDSYAFGEYLNTDVSTNNNALIDGVRRSIINQTIDSITLEVTNKANKSELALTVGEDGVATLSANADKIALKSGELSIKSDQFTLDADGNATFSGELNAAKGSFNCFKETDTATATFGEYEVISYGGCPQHIFTETCVDVIAGYDEDGNPIWTKLISGKSGCSTFLFTDEQAEALKNADNVTFKSYFTEDAITRIYGYNTIPIMDPDAWDQSFLISKYFELHIENVSPNWRLEKYYDSTAKAYTGYKLYNFSYDEYWVDKATKIKYAVDDPITDLQERIYIAEGGPERDYHILWKPSSEYKVFDAVLGATAIAINSDGISVSQADGTQSVSLTPDGPQKFNTDVDITGNLTVSQETVTDLTVTDLTVTNPIDGSLAVVSNQTWGSAEGLHIYRYEGADTTEYNLPISFCYVLCFLNGTRGYAEAFDWRDGCVANRWISNLHGDVTEGKWSTWQSVLSGSIPAGLIRTESNEGYFLDAFGDLVHLSTGTDNNYWNIMNKEGVSKFRVYYESGNAEIDGNLTVANGNIGASGSLWSGSYITVQGHSSAIGTVVTATESGKSLTAQTSNFQTGTALTSVSLDPGTWVVNGYIYNTTGSGCTMGLGINTESGTLLLVPSDDGASNSYEKYGSWWVYAKEVSAIVKNEDSAAKTYYLNARSSAAVSGVNAYIRAVRIA